MGHVLHCIHRKVWCCRVIHRPTLLWFAGPRSPWKRSWRKVIEVINTTLTLIECLVFLQLLSKAAASLPCHKMRKQRQKMVKIVRLVKFLIWFTMCMYNSIYYLYAAGRDRAQLADWSKTCYVTVTVIVFTKKINSVEVPIVFRRLLLTAHHIVLRKLLLTAHQIYKNGLQ